MKLSDYAKHNSLTYRTAWEHFRKGLIPHSRKLPTGTIVIDEVKESRSEDLEKGVIVYARTSSSTNKKLLDDQAVRVTNYAVSRGYRVKSVVKEFGSGLNDRRPKLTKILKDDNYDRIIVEHKDRLTRFGFEWFQLFTGNRIEVINQAKSEDEDITRDLISIIHCFSAKIYGLRRKTRKLIGVIKETVD